MGRSAVVETPATEERRPTALLLVYAWDMVRAVLALLGALSAFGGGVTVNGRTLTVPIGGQILTALGAAALAAALIVVATLLTRHQQWVRRAQIVVLVMAIAMALGSFAVDQLVTRSGFDVAAFLGVVLVALLDLLALVAMTGPRVAAWFREPGPIPAYVTGLLGFWAVTMVAFVVLRALA